MGEEGENVIESCEMFSGGTTIYETTIPSLNPAGDMRKETRYMDEVNRRLR